MHIPELPEGADPAVWFREQVDELRRRDRRRACVVWVVLAGGYGLLMAWLFWRCS